MKLSLEELELLFVSLRLQAAEAADMRNQKPRMAVIELQGRVMKEILARRAK